MSRKPRPSKLRRRLSRRERRINTQSNRDTDHIEKDGSDDGADDRIAPTDPKRWTKRKIRQSAPAWKQIATSRWKRLIEPAVCKRNRRQRYRSHRAPRRPRIGDSRPIPL